MAFAQATVYSNTTASDTVCLLKDTITVEWYYRGADITSFQLFYSVKNSESETDSWINTGASLSASSSSYTWALTDNAYTPGKIFTFKIVAIYSGEWIDQVTTNSIRVGGVMNVCTDNSNTWKQAPYSYVYTNGSWHTARLIQVYHNGSWNNYS